MSETPILDLEQPVPKPPRRWFAISIGAVIGMAIGAILIFSDRGVLFDWHWPAMNGLLLFPLLFVGVAVHELGHLIAGKLVGLDAGGIVVGPLSVRRSGERWTIRFEWRELFRMGGLFKPLLPADREFQAADYAWMVGGGPVASVLCTVCFFAWARSYDSGVWDWVGTFFWVSLFLVFISLIPFNSGLQRSDGARLWQLIRHPQQSNGFITLLGVQTEETRGVRPREWAGELVNRLKAIEPGTSEYVPAQLFLYHRLSDEGTRQEALVHLENILVGCAKVGSAFRGVLFVEAGYACARMKEEPDKARVWRKRAWPVLRRRPDLFQTLDASIAMCEGRYEEALRLWRAACARVRRRKLDSGVVRMALENWEERARVCEERIAAELASPDATINAQ